ncbi:WhiB family transcriptional regulator [Streptomyces cinereoruber]|uniref:WhiB family transcriptional regulator n=1 Tax=Streptomyces cinereoruber TaxID=67260 RepID=UPI003F533FB0
MEEQFVQGNTRQRRAETVCTGCPVHTERLAEALHNQPVFGVRGGMTEAENAHGCRKVSIGL